MGDAKMIGHFGVILLTKVSCVQQLAEHALLSPPVAITEMLRVLTTIDVIMLVCVDVTAGYHLVTALDDAISKCFFYMSIHQWHH